MGVRDTIAKAVMGIKAYHSSPHDFDKFDLKKIGTGEGAQVYGHGLYFAENPAVSGQGGQYWQQFKNRFSGPEAEAISAFQQQAFDREKALAQLDRQLRGYIPGSQLHNELSEAKRLLESGPVGPRTYEVNIKADPAHFLDWDKPLREQGILDALSGSRRASVQDVLNRIGWQKPTRDVYGTDIGPVTGQDFYKALSYDLTGTPNSAQASKAIKAGGVPGIKYLDEGSRMNATSTFPQLREAPRTSNYVVFDPANIDILKKYGVAAAPTGALAADQMGSTFDQRYYGEQP